MTQRRFLAFYGDDQTGSTDVMEALELRSVPTVLFTGIPTPEQEARFHDRLAVGIAGTSRSETTAWMDANLPSIFVWLKDQDAEICHYKICSTFDSSPTIGSIGRALDIGAAIFNQDSTALVVGAPELRRYTAFGNLFAGFLSENFRIDRHPVMSRHPVTPMDEADIGRHLQRQTEKSVGLIDLVALKRNISPEAVDATFDVFPIVHLDVLDDETQRAVGRHIWRRRTISRFVVGSSGVEYALLGEGTGVPIAGRVRDFPKPGSRGPVAVVSGSCSPTTERQIRFAEKHGFEGIALDPGLLVGEQRQVEIERAVSTGSAVLSAGVSPLFYTALGTETPGAELQGMGHEIGTALGQILDRLIKRHTLRRAVVAGGDTSSHAIGQLGIYALECLMPLPLSPGSPLCSAHRVDGGVLEVAFKGGQVGGDDYFPLVRDI
ncbi:MAG: four-carbon acid sugar kinase family protein [Rhizobiaceae bacterium]|nr:four-carbon acid sugar kinase family protein [Rhizobiaceae bacterium]